VVLIPRHLFLQLHPNSATAIITSPAAPTPEISDLAIKELTRLL